ncbi:MULTISPECIES: DUF5133 domain-containing protein [unclassified Streptomyces]|uniref:DUF5133 domain-containing protein n=1 Tax=unclassified Streptomyces TaxID=2593676 RepID=UPI00380609CC
MLMPHPAVLRTLVDEYEAAVLAGPGEATRTQDLAYTLCVSTGTREVPQALEVAREWLAAATVTGTAPAPRVAAAASAPLAAAIADAPAGRPGDEGPHACAA